MEGNAARASSQEKNVVFTVAHPGDVTVPSHSPPRTTTVASVETSRERRRRERRTASRSSSRALGCQVSASLTGPSLHRHCTVTAPSLQDGHVHGLAQPLLLERIERPVVLDRGEALVDAVDERVVLLEQHAELLRLAGLLLELADDRRGRDLHRGDE